MFATQRTTALVAVAAALSLLAACGGSDDSDNPSPPATTTTEPAITAPPTLTEEEQAEADIQATFEQLIAAWDNFKANASDYGGTGDSTWNADLVATWPVDGQANLELTNWVAGWRNSEIEQRGSADIRSHTISDLRLETSAAQLRSANSTACLDLTELRFVGFDGGEPEAGFEPDQYQRWDMTWLSRAGANGTGNTWTLATIELSRNEPC